MNIFPKGTPRIGPYASITYRELISGCISKVISNFENRRPKVRFRNFRISSLERGVVKILSLEDLSSVSVRKSGYFPYCSKNKRLVNCF
jgi:hypothetical protein